MKLAAYCLLLGTTLALPGTTQSTGPAMSDDRAIVPWADKHMSSGELVIDRQRAFTITIDPSLGATAHWQSAVADLNGDGIDDLVIGLPFASPEGRPEAGLVAVIHGRKGGFDPIMDLASLDGDNGFVVHGSRAGERLGWSLAALGDFSGSGMDHLAIGAPGHENGLSSGAGAVFVLTDTQSYPASMSSDDLRHYQAWHVHAPIGAGSFGFSVAGIGDFNADGLSDLAVGDPDAAPEGMTGAGSVSVVHRAPGSHAARNYRFGQRIHGSEPGQHLGQSIVLAGNATASDQPGLLIGAPGGNLTGPDPRAGATYLLAGGSHTGASPVAIADLLGSTAMELSAGTEKDRFGAALAVAVDGQLLIGAPGHDGGAGAVYRIHPADQRLSAGFDLNPAPDMERMSGQSPGGRFGAHLMPLGDLTGNGHADLAMVADHAPDQDAWWFRLHRVSAASDSGQKPLSLEPRQDSMNVRLASRGLVSDSSGKGWGLAGAGSLDGNEQRNWIVTASRHNSDDQTTGTLHVFPARVRSEHAPVINEGDGFTNLIADVNSTSTVQFTVGPDPDGYQCDANAVLVDGVDGPLTLTCAGTGAGRTLEIDGDLNDSAGLHMLYVTITDPGTGESTTESFLLGLREPNSPTPTPMPNRLTYDTREVTSDFTLDFVNVLNGAVLIEDDDNDEFAFWLELPGERITEADGEVTVLVDPVEDQMDPGTYVASILAEGFEVEAAYTGFRIEVFPETDPFINDGAGMGGPYSTPESDELLIEFTRGDLVDPPESLDLVLIIETPPTFPQERFDIDCDPDDPAQCELAFTPEPGDGDLGTLSLAMRVCHPDCLAPERDSINMFEIEIEQLPNPPQINNGEPLDDLAVDEGQSATITFTVTEAPPPTGIETDYIVTAASDNPDVIDAGELQVELIDEASGLYELTITTSLDQIGAATVTILATDDFGQEHDSSFIAEVLERDPPLINSGAPLPELTVTAGETQTLAFAVDDALDAPEDIVVTAASTNPDILPDDAIGLDIPCPGGICLLVIDAPVDVSGTAGIEIEATNTADRTSTEVITVVIEPMPELPVINNNEPLPDQEIFEGQSGSVTFTVSEPVPCPPDDDQLAVTAVSGNPAVIADTDLEIIDLGNDSFELLIQTSVEQSGTTDIAIEADNCAGTTTAVLNVGVLQRPLPQINGSAGIPDQSVAAGDTLTAAFTVSDVIDAATALDVSASSGDTTVLPDTALSLGGTGQLRTLTIQTTAGQFGSVNLSVRVGNTAGRVRVAPFTLAIEQQDPPVINANDPLPDREVLIGDMIEVDFIVADPVDASEALTVSAASSDPSILPASGLELTGSGEQRSLIIDASEASIGATVITVTTTNSAGVSASTSFGLLVLEPQTSLDIEFEAIETGPASDRYLRLDVENTGEYTASLMELEMQVSGDYTIIGIYNLAAECTDSSGTVLCDPEQIGNWSCDAESSPPQCTLDELPATVAVPVVVHLQGQGEGLLQGQAAARNAAEVSDEVPIDD